VSKKDTVELCSTQRAAMGIAARCVWHRGTVRFEGPCGEGVTEQLEAGR